MLAKIDCHDSVVHFVVVVVVGNVIQFSCNFLFSPLLLFQGESLLESSLVTEEIQVHA